MEAFLIPFLTITIAEVFDKSQIAILLLATQTKKHTQFFLGVILAFCLLTGLAIFAGESINKFLPTILVKLLSGTLFIIFGIKAFFKTKEKINTNNTNGNIFLSGFILVLLSEWGDKTQLTTVFFATRFKPLFVFLGAITALSLLSFAAIKLGNLFAHSTQKNKISKVAGLVFIIIGISFIIL